MNSPFSYEGFFSRTVNKIIDCICLSFLWIILSLPVFTAGAASAALYYTVNKLFNQESGTLWKCFWSSFKCNFKQATSVWIPLLIFYALFGLNAYYGYVFYELGNLPLVVLILIAVMAAAVISWGCYLFPYIARFTNSTKEVIHNCFFLFLKHFKMSILLLVIHAASFLCAVCIPLGIAFAPAVCVWLSSAVLERIFRQYMSDEDRTAEELTSIIKD